MLLLSFDLHLGLSKIHPHSRSCCFLKPINGISLCCCRLLLLTSHYHWTIKGPILSLLLKSEFTDQLCSLLRSCVNPAEMRWVSVEMSYQVGLSLESVFPLSFMSLMMGTCPFFFPCFGVSVGLGFFLPSPELAVLLVTGFGLIMFCLWIWLLISLLRVSLCQCSCITVES